MPTAPSPSPRLGSRVAGRRWRKENKFLFGQGCRKVMPREIWCCGQGSSWHPGDGRLLAASHSGKSQSSPGTCNCILEVMGQPQGFLTAPARGRLVGNGTCPHHLLVGMLQQTLHCDHQQLLHHENSLAGQGEVKSSEGMRAPLSQPIWACGVTMLPSHLQQQEERDTHRLWQ